MNDAGGCGTSGDAGAFGDAVKHTAASRVAARGATGGDVCTSAARTILKTFLTPPPPPPPSRRDATSASAASAAARASAHAVSVSSNFTAASAYASAASNDPNASAPWSNPGTAGGAAAGGFRVLNASSSPGSTFQDYGLIALAAAAVVAAVGGVTDASEK